MSDQQQKDLTFEAWAEQAGIESWWVAGARASKGWGLAKSGTAEEFQAAIDAAKGIPVGDAATPPKQSNPEGSK